jgi:hypothetical protein
MADERHIEQGYACAEVVELASEFLEGAMTPEQRTRFELHLNLCDGCSTFLEQVRATAAHASSLWNFELHDDCQRRLIAACRDWERE